ncbi:cbb3-type cytochrome c oxidase subunit II [Desulfurivibrio alkaliphilus]|uniref:Cytochrome c oxidase, cbb3-type, subunit II n=1 Tax=Desulfurivibrio alkaliphilus (strain DSM 19089 / UNIQEM U267 / AHT2) TaxID=589865 RepID=D6Z605_DESAT|nr:cbb3-type cytochrome c oxidase subunit II [Desulfurivibrio alkaliphilus]ADH84887.1 cytochrome c oxidase, cbb3-type, subunit II [Desulfurivibrio alkaliphilus AHT 2]
MWERNPVIFLLLATAVIMVGTIVTMVLPFAYVNTERDAIESVVPYTALELAGRDVYIKEGCNNCHTQTVRPLVAEVIRYGDYSKSGEFVYDRPHLWGSRRTGPDLARIGGKYPDQWHYEHMRNPAGMVPGSNMPPYAFLDNRSVDPELTRRKMDVLGFPYTEEEIRALAGKTDMDAMVAYMQKLGSDIPWREQQRVALVGELENPFSGDAAAIAEGRELYDRNCAACHGSGLRGGFAASLDRLHYPEEVFFRIIHDGIQPLNMPSFAGMGSERIWKIVTYIDSEQVAP